jgi:HEXXH motif-containing protein
VSRHRLPVEFLDTLAAGAGSTAITRYLWETELSRRLLLIAALFDHSDVPGVLTPLPPAADAWSVLERAQEKDRAAVDAVLQHPHVGSALAYALRRQRGGATSDLPAWVDLGAVHVLALVAAARAGLEWSTRVPVRRGTVMLPTLGMARFPGTDPATCVDARTAAGTIHLLGPGREVVVPPDPTDDTDGWWCLRRLEVAGDNLMLNVWLDDLDWFRDLADPEPPARLDDAAFARWRRLIEEAWTLLCRHHADSAAALAEGVVSVVPLRAEPGWDTRSASNGEAFGSVMVSEPPDAVVLAVSLVHEFQHIKLGALMHLLKLVDDDDGSLYYAPWRDDPRPLGGFLQGIYAFFGIAEFWRQHRLTAAGQDAALAAYEYLYARGQTCEALDSVRDAPALTPTGHRLVARLAGVVDTWLADPVDPEVVRLAGLTAESHRITWRLRHQRPCDADVAALAKAWLASQRPELPSPAELRPAPGLRWSQRIPALARRRVLGTASREGTDDPLVVADRALVAGDIVTATQAYLARLAQAADGSSDEILAWVGLALALSESGAAALRCRPDLVRAVHDEVAMVSGTRADPVRIAAWLAPVVAGAG